MTHIPSTRPPHPKPHAVVVIILRTDEDHIQQRLNTVMGVAATYDVPPNTSPHVFAKHAYELTEEELGAMKTLIGEHGVDLLNLWDQYPNKVGVSTRDDPDKDWPPSTKRPVLRDVTDEISRTEDHTKDPG